MESFVHLVWIIGALTAVWGICVLFKPIWLRQWLILTNKGQLVYAIAGVKVVIGVCFLILATQCQWPIVIIVFGILMAGGSILFSLLPLAKIHGFMNWAIARPIWVYRLWAILAVLLGGLILYAGMPS